uniref:Uncharacterized protein LOC111122188 n=1 Tax=Crassostrea virginica TaxID=6565 RepID=A0A8B8CYE4_CRAVI|nr:uncharacterized protein LOC111122188 [Crassostrea virginica]
MAMECLRISLLLIVAVFHTSSTATDLDSKDNTTLMPVTTLSKASSVLRHILNQENLVRLTVVQRMPSLMMNAKAYTLVKSLKRIIEEMQILKAENQRQKDELTVLKEDVRQIKITQANCSNELLSFKKNHLDFSLAVTEIIKHMLCDENAQLLSSASRVLSGLPRSFDCDEDERTMTEKKNISRYLFRNMLYK